MEDLSPKEKGFVNDYIDTGNATEAAARNYDVANRNSIFYCISTVDRS